MATGRVIAGLGKASRYLETQQWATFAVTWHLYDATWQNPFDSAEKISRILQGRHKPIYHPTNKCGDHVVVTNCKHIALPGQEWEKRVYFHHTGYASGASWTMAWELHQRDPTMIMWKAVYNSMRGTLQRRRVMQFLHLYDTDTVPADVMKNISNQLRPLRPVPLTLANYTQEEIEKFPKIVDYPIDYVKR